MILEQIHDPADVKRLDGDEVQQLCQELRRFLISRVSQTGGHLASNLGVVELTVAIHRVFDTSKDRLVFDVGHQCYVHKALTGRQALFETLRQFGGLSGFPKPYESGHDAFIAGHASNSVSVALGMARARTLQHKDYSVLALIGDGAMSGGLSFEGLNNAGASQEPLIVILNDNGMSINPNVGGLSRHLAGLRTKSGYYQFKKWYRDALEHTQAGQKVYELSHDVKTALKKSIFPNSTFFEDMGFTYMGPVDGHDVQKLTDMLTWARELHCPVLLHVQTAKGKGCHFAERDPGRFHGVDPFDPLTGKSKKMSRPSFSSVFGEELTALAQEDPSVCAITAAMESGTGLTPFAKACPERFFDVGIAEGHAVSMAAGMAKQGMRPVFAVYSSFLQRGYDMLIHDVSLDGLHVVFGVDRAGLVGADGETHHGCFDALYLPQVPGMTVYCPASFAELRRMLRRAVHETDGPVAVRYPRGGEGAYYSGCGSDAPADCLREGTDCTILSYGVLINHALEAAQRLEQEGISVRVVKLNRIAPLDGGDLAGVLRGTRRLVVLEDCLACGCVGQRVAALLAEAGEEPEKLVLKNAGMTLPPQGTVPQLEHALGLDADGVAESVRRCCMSNKTRLDVLLVERGFAPTRQKAQAIIMAGSVFVAGQRVDKPGTAVPNEAELEVRGHTLRYVSRGGLKLEKAMQTFPITLEGKTCADIGASTGGFTDCMLQNGAKRVYAVDVGYGQLDWNLRSDARVVCLERTNARYLSGEQIPEPLDFASIDVSFISLKLIFPALYPLLREGGEIACLIKPQFEAGREKVGKKGVVRDPTVHLEVLQQFLRHAKENNFTVLGITYSPIRGPEGNIEYLGFLRKSDEPDTVPELSGVVAASHDELKD